MKNPNKLVMSDLHLGNHQQFAGISKDGINTRLLLQHNAIQKAMQTGVKRDCKILVIAGDIFHVRGLVEVEAVNVFHDILKEAEELFENIYIITGNHDITHENTQMFNTLNVFSEHKNVKIIDPKSSVTYQDMKTVFFGYTNDTEYINDELKYFDDAEKYDLYCHQAIFGVQYRNHVLTEGVELKYLKRFKRVFNGHIHEPKKLSYSIYNLGSLVPMDFGDVGERYYYVISDNKVEKFQSDHPLFITVKSPKDVRKDNFYRVVSDKLIETGDNVKLVINKKLMFDRGVDYSNHVSVIESYCKNIKHEDMAKSGLLLFKEANA